jgi:hypothetical protein
MKTYLPHYFKRIGILFVLVAMVLSITGGIDDIRKGWKEGGNAASLDRKTVETISEQDKTIKPYFTEDEAELYASWSLFFSITGFFLYLFSKEKIDDEFMQHLRLKSMLQAFLVSWIIYGTAKVFSSIIPLDGIYILQMQLIVYVIIFRHNKNLDLSIETEN